MTFDEAIRVVSRQRPCPHDNIDTRLGDGTTWAKCHDCGATFDRANHERRKRNVEQFDDAIDVLKERSAR